MSNEVMKRELGLSVPLLIFMPVLLFSGYVAADKKEDSDVVKTLNKAQGMLRQLSQEKAELQARAEATSKELEDSKKALENMNAQLQSKAKELQGVQAELKKKTDYLSVFEKNNEILKKNNETLKHNNEILKNSFSDQLEKANERIHASAEQSARLSEELRNNQQDNELLVNAVKERANWIEGCTKKNADLIKVNHEIIQSINNKGFWESLKEAEPLTGIGSVQKELKQDEFRYKLNDLRVTPWKEANAIR